MTIQRTVPNLVGEDLDAAREFYADFLGFEVAMDEPGFMMFRSPSNPSVQITVGTQRGIDVAQVSIEVSDVDAAHAEALRRGLEIVYPLTDEPWAVRRFFVRDPTGTVINVLSHH